MNRIILLIALLCYLPAIAQDNHTISGVITDKKTGETLIGATVSVPSINVGTTTNEYGFYSLSLPDGSYTLNNTELSNRFDADKVVMIEKFKPLAILSAVYYDADKKQFNAKRFKIETLTLNTKFQFIKEGEGNYLEWITSHANPIIKIKTGKKKYLPSEEIINLEELVDVMGWKAIGNKLCEKDLLEISLVIDEEESKQRELF